MNYRHAYHAGNHTEVFKHSVLSLLLLELCKKSKPFTVLDTHAGTGIYDLLSTKAKKTGEAAAGIGRVLDKNIPTATPYLELVRHLNPYGLTLYPGSPTIIQNFLRQDDRLIACELHERDVISLRKHFKFDNRVSIHHRNGYEAIFAFVPPPTRRGLVFIDPPFEARDEFRQMVDYLNSGIKKWPTGMFVAWYPIKGRSEIFDMRKRYSSTSPPTLCCEFLRERIDGVRLTGSGLLICNPPWKFESKLATLCNELLSAFDARAGTHSIEWWISERA